MKLPQLVTLIFEDGTTVQVDAYELEVYRESPILYYSSPGRALQADSSSKLTLVGYVRPPIVVEMPFVPHDRFTLASLLVLDEEEEVDSDHVDLSDFEDRY